MWDATAGLYYDHARWYDSATGRFIGQEPTGFAAGDANLYRYVANSPTNFTDPTGTEAASLGTTGMQQTMAGTLALMPQTQAITGLLTQAGATQMQQTLAETLAQLQTVKGVRNL